jgi:hypothetical protein
MRRSRFRRLLEAYGADPARWPSAERDPAVLHAQTDPSARDDLAAAARLDTALETSPGGIAESKLAALIDGAAARIADLPVVERRPTRPARWRALGAPMLIPALALGCFALGLLIGLNVGPAGYTAVHDQFASHALIADLAP